MQEASRGGLLVDSSGLLAIGGQEQSSGGQLEQPAAMWKLPEGPKFHGILLLASRRPFPG